MATSPQKIGRVPAGHSRRRQNQGKSSDLCTNMWSNSHGEDTERQSIRGHLQHAEPGMSCWFVQHSRRRRLRLGTGGEALGLASLIQQPIASNCQVNAARASSLLPAPVPWVRTDGHLLRGDCQSCCPECIPACSSGSLPNAATLYLALTPDRIAADPSILWPRDLNKENTNTQPCPPFLFPQATQNSALDKGHLPRPLKRPGGHQETATLPSHLLSLSPGQRKQTHQARKRQSTPPLHSEDLRYSKLPPREHHTQDQHQQPVHASTHTDPGDKFRTTIPASNLQDSLL
ncbi:hypothetical protein B0T25DRAFT_20220 [Lasiosphaeria hispida]|uniref:Uncharacterized protein n=1 Tax=Lasiosphaeria hispida TaxID=260671 RepID=A0AAJ0MJJ5_9PEZI|nr:hypothetical protein B0T25DRAFT_20220 [Lasiosphaeria hispida]